MLLAEDTPVNQTLALRLLEKLGHTTVVVNNGREAVEACQGAHFDAILMDLQMPEMGGLEATAAIRQLEAQGGGRHTPIIALTAHALPADQERCRAAGMDLYLTKPINPASLVAALNDATGIGTRHEAEAVSVVSRDAPAFDRDKLLGNLGDDAELLRQLAEMYLEDENRMRQQVSSTQASGDLKTFQTALHSIKGAVANFGADQAVAAATRLETLCRAGQTTEIADALAGLDTQLDRLRASLQKVLEA